MMGVTEIFLLTAGGIIFILSFLIPARVENGQILEAPMSREAIKAMVDREMDTVKEHVDDVVDEAVTYAMEKTERSLERLSNEKIMAINEYSDTVLSEIHRNHEEAMFLYDMLNNKHVNLKNTVSEVNRTVKEAEETVNNFQKIAPETIDIPKAAFVRTAEEQMARVSEQADQKEPAEPPMTEEPEEEAAGNSNDRIRELYSQGKDKVAIARELGLGVGEVKLVIDLFTGNDTSGK